MLSDAEIEIFGYIAGALLIISFIPQIVKILMLKSAKEISLWFIIVQLLVNAMFITYGVLSDAKPIYIPSCILTIEKILILVLKYYFYRNASFYECNTEEIKLESCLCDTSKKCDENVTIEMIENQFNQTTSKFE